MTRKVQERECHPEHHGGEKDAQRA
jgi:hypothetical protein